MLNFKIVIQLFLLLLALTIYIFINKYFVKTEVDSFQNQTSKIQKFKNFNQKMLLKIFNT